MKELQFRGAAMRRGPPSGQNSRTTTQAAAGAGGGSEGGVAVSFVYRLSRVFLESAIRKIALH